jgi:hypothetical protein
MTKIQNAELPPEVPRNLDPHSSLDCCQLASSAIPPPQYIVIAAFFFIQGKCRHQLSLFGQTIVFDPLGWHNLLQMMDRFQLVSFFCPTRR